MGNDLLPKPRLKWIKELQAVFQKSRKIVITIR